MRGRRESGVEESRDRVTERPFGAGQEARPEVVLCADGTAELDSAWSVRWARAKSKCKWQNAKCKMDNHLSWTVHRAREAPGKTAVAGVFVAAFLVFSYLVFGFLLAMLAAVVFFLALNTYFLPVTYTFTDKGIEVDKRIFTARYEWKQFRRWFRTTGGIVISPFSRRTYLDNFRGVHLLLPSEERRTRNEERGAETAVRTEEIVAYLEKRFTPAPPDERLKLDDKADDVRS